MVSEVRKQSMAWMEMDYSKHTYFRWKVKWQLEHLGALGTMGETTPLKLHLPHPKACKTCKCTCLVCSLSSHCSSGSQMTMSKYIWSLNWLNAHKDNVYSLVNWCTSCKIMYTVIKSNADSIFDRNAKGGLYTLFNSWMRKQWTSYSSWGKFHSLARSLDGL